jgi:2-oxoisovalerate dehydrogenase E2 component (dihydrolipoyl transacylase)
MSVFPVKLPDVGEGVAEAELIEWYVEVGDQVTPDTVLADVMTDKATVEISSPVTGVVTFRIGEPGEVLAVGTEFVGIELDGSAPPEPSGDEHDDRPPEPSLITSPGETTVMSERTDSRTVRSSPEPTSALPPSPPPRGPELGALVPGTSAPSSHRPTAAPAVRARARSLGIDLATVAGSGPTGRVVHADLDRSLTAAAPPPRTRGTPIREPHTEVQKGLRKRIAKRLSQSWAEIPHITYVDAIDVTDLEALRAELNSGDRPKGARLTILPFLVRAIVIACGEQPRLNAHFDTESRTLSIVDQVHVGIATQTADGLMVPVVHDADARDLWDLATEIGRVATAARDGKATSAELSGSTITITSLGAMGGLMTTPLINQPEVAIVGVNKIETRPVWQNGTFVPRQMCNLSSSFDHRVVDGWDAATFVQRIKVLLEMPALLFIDHDS